MRERFFNRHALIHFYIIHIRHRPSPVVPSSNFTGVNSSKTRVVILSVSAQKSTPSVTVIIPAWNAWDHTRNCLQSLQPTLRPGDQVVVIDNASTDDTSSELVKFPWIEVLTNDVNRGFAPACNQGAQVAHGDILVFLNNDTILFDGWLDELLLPFSDPEVGAVGPRSNNVSGDQLVEDISYRFGELADMAEYAEAWRRTHAGQTSECHRLVGFCLAVRADTFRTVDGFDEQYLIGGLEDDDLCMKLRGAGLRLVVAHGSFVHHVAHVTFDSNGVDWHRHQVQNLERFRRKWGVDKVPPLRLLSVCLIVKDEEQMLPPCLESIADVADEIVVYDTGSSDRTVEIARAYGARVIEGYWDDSFARARNAALDEAFGEWVLSLDADETFLADPGPLRTLLADRRSDIEAYLVSIENLHGAGNARTVHTAIRLFRRTSCTWKHRLHEQVVAADDSSRNLRIGYLSGTRIIHCGYSAEVFEAKKKTERNLALAKAAIGDDDVDRGYAIMNYGRALESAGYSIEAVEALTEAASITEDPITHRLALKNLIYILARLKRFDEALVQVVELRKISVSQIAADIAEGHVRISMGEVEAGLSLLARVPLRGRDDEGMEWALHMLAAMRGEALASLGRYTDAADVVLDAVRSEGVLEADLGELTLWLIKAGRSPSEIAGALDVDDLMPVLGRVLRQSPMVADLVLEGIWERFPDRLEPLAAAGRLGPRLPVARALMWSSRLRGCGLVGACPLVAMAHNGDLDPRIRILAAAAAFGSFGDHSVVNAVHEALSRLDGAALAQSTEEISHIAPGLLEARHVDSVDIGEKVPLATTSSIERGRQKSVTAMLPKVASVTRRGGVNVVGPFESITNYGEIARTLVETLTGNGVAVSTNSYHSAGRDDAIMWTHNDRGNYPFDTTLFVLSPEDLANFVIDNGAAAFEGRYMIGVWSWDLEKPSEIIGTAARMVHEVWVPSMFTANTIAQVTDRPVKRVLIPVLTDRPVTRELSDDPSFCFLASIDYASGFERQNPLGIVEAFRTAFRPREGPRLVIQTTHSSQYRVEHARLVDALCNRPDIVLIENSGDSPARFLEGRVAGRSCFVSLHRSEGTGLLLARAMALGIPTIVTGYSFSAELQGGNDSFQVPFEIKPIPDNEYRCMPGGQWAEPDIDKAAKAMRLVVEQPKFAMAKAGRAKKRQLRQFSPGQAARDMKDRLVTIDRLRYRNSIRPGRPGTPIVTKG